MRPHRRAHAAVTLSDMNVYAIVILAALGIGFLLDLIANLLNLKALRDRPPEELRQIYPPGEYAKSQRYTRERTRFGLVSSTFDLAVLLVFWFAGGFNRLDLWVRSFDLGPIWTGLLFIGILALAKSILDLPFELYSTFVIEERYGFNRTTVRTFVLDLVKGLVLAIVLGGPLVAAILWFFDRAGSTAWIYCWLLSSAVSLILLFVYPRWIMPLFNRFEPLEEGELRQALSDYARSVGFALADVFVMDGSRRSSRTNAFFSGFGRNKRIALFDTLIEKHSKDELVAIFAHEVGHYAKGHIVKGLILSIVHSGLTFYLLSLFLGHRGLFEAFSMDHMSIYAGLLFFALLYAPIEMLLSFFFNLMLRRYEFQADRFAAETTGEPGAMVSALKKLSADNLSNLTPHPFYVFLNESHPPLRARVAALQSL